MCEVVPIINFGSCWRFFSFTTFWTSDIRIEHFKEKIPAPKELICRNCNNFRANFGFSLFFSNVSFFSFFTVICCNKEENKMPSKSFFYVAEVSTSVLAIDKYSDPSIFIGLLKCGIVEPPRSFSSWHTLQVIQHRLGPQVSVSIAASVV